MLTRFWRCAKGSPAVEFAILAPIIIVTAAGIIELGSYINDTVTLEKSVRAGAMAAARSPSFNGSFSAGDETIIENLVMRGSADPAAPYLLQGWNDAGANVSVSTFQVSLANSGGTVDVVRIFATVPYVEVITGFFSFMGGLTITAEHEQIRVGG